MERSLQRLLKAEACYGRIARALEVMVGPALVDCHVPRSPENEMQKFELINSVSLMHFTPEPPNLFSYFRLNLLSRPTHVHSIHLKFHQLLICEASLDLQQ